VVASPPVLEAETQREREREREIKKRSIRKFKSKKNGSFYVAQNSCCLR
jgi:hypothetical protein